MKIRIIPAVKVERKEIVVENIKCSPCKALKEEIQQLKDKYGQDYYKHLHETKIH